MDVKTAIILGLIKFSAAILIGIVIAKLVSSTRER